MTTTRELTFGRALRDLRESRGLSRARVASRLTNRDGEPGVDPDNIKRWEDDENQPSLLAYRELCALFGVEEIGPRPTVLPFPVVIASRVKRQASSSSEETASIRYSAQTLATQYVPAQSSAPESANGGIRADASEAA